MSAPPLPTTGQILLDEIGPSFPGDDKRFYAFTILMGGVGTAMDDTYDLVGDVTHGLGWSVLLDPDLCPLKYLPWLAQFAGVELPQGYTEAQARYLIAHPPAYRRGTISAIKDAVRATIHGTQHIVLMQRLGGDPFAIGIVTLSSETPDATATRIAIENAVPWWINVTYDAVLPLFWRDVEIEFATWTALKAARATWTALNTTLP